MSQITYLYKQEILFLQFAVQAKHREHYPQDFFSQLHKLFPKQSFRTYLQVWEQ